MKSKRKLDELKEKASKLKEEINKVSYEIVSELFEEIPTLKNLSIIAVDAYDDNNNYIDYRIRDLNGLNVDVNSSYFDWWDEEDSEMIQRLVKIDLTKDEFELVGDIIFSFSDDFLAELADSGELNRSKFVKKKKPKKPIKNINKVKKENLE